MSAVDHHPTSLTQLLFASANASVHFALACLEPVGANLRATSTFVDAAGNVMHWHDFGDLEGPGWAANAIGGATLLFEWGRNVGDATICDSALRLADHILDDGFVRDDGFIWPYWNLARERFCLNYAHTDDWFCPGSLAKVGVQMLDLATLLGADPRAVRLRDAARGLGGWLRDHVELLPSGWVPRRVTPEGLAYEARPEGGPDPLFAASADGLTLADLWLRLGDLDRARALIDAFVAAGGIWGSINHDTYDSQENVAYAVGFRVLRRAADRLNRPDLRHFAYDVALPAMSAFRMDRDEHGVVTEGLFWMERSWDTAYLWENAEVAQAYLEAWQETGDTKARDTATATLTAIAHHHSGGLGFLAEGIDWNNHVSQRHHVGLDYYGAIRYTEPLLNNLHLVGPTLTYLTEVSEPPPAAVDLRSCLATLRELPTVPASVRALESRQGRLLLRLFYPVIATDAGVAEAVAFCKRAGVAGVLLFDMSYDADPAMMTLDALEPRFQRLRAVVPVFRDAGLEVHIDVMVTMGHTDGGGAQPEAFGHQWLVDAGGAVSRVSPCPLDSSFLGRVDRVYRWAAACDADAVWVDDDARFLGHDLDEMTCFCPRHLAELRERTGQAWTRESLVSALADDGRGTLRATWLDVQEDAMMGLARTVERAVHSVSSRQAVGLMSVGIEAVSAEGRRTDRLLRALSGPATPPMLRPGAGFWHGEAPSGLLTKTEAVSRQIAYLGRDVRTVAEIENHPYSPYQKSRRLLALEMALHILAGTHDISLNILPETHPFRSGEVDYAGFLQTQHPFLRELGRARAGKRRIGVGVEGREDVPRTLRMRGGGLKAWTETRPWELILSRMGIPVGRLYDAPHLLGEAVVYTDRYALGSALQDGALLSPGAVCGLLDQGWGDELGVLDVAPARADANEVITGDPLNGAHVGSVLPVRHYWKALRPHAYRLSADAETSVLSTWRGVDGGDAGVAAATVALADGRRVGLLPFEPTSPLPAVLQPAHRDQWAAMLAWVARAPLPLRVVAGMNVVPQVFVDRAGGVLVALANLSSDDVVAQLDAPVLSGVSLVERLCTDGTWVEVGNTSSIDVAAWSLTILHARRP